MDDIPTVPQSEIDSASPLAVVSYGLAKEIQLWPDALIFISREEGIADRFPLEEIQCLSVQPGERVPSKLLILLTFADSTTIIAAEGMTNVRSFQQMLPQLQSIAPHITFEPSDLDEQLTQALINRRQVNFGCYGVFLGSVLLIILIFALANFISHR
jgi:hypothetical protein